MTLERRLDGIEKNLSPAQLVLRWLAEVQSFADLESYVASLLVQDRPVPPLDRLAREAIACARASNRGKRAEAVSAAVRTALRETIFRFELVMRINVPAHELLDREALIDAALSANLALVFNHDERQADPKRLEHLARLRDLIACRVSELHAAAEARSIVQERFLDGHDALFPGVSAEWDDRVKTTAVIADMAIRMAEIDGAPAKPDPDPEALSRRAAELFADLVEPAKSEALQALDEGQRALEIAAGWVRTKLSPTPAATSEEPTL